MANLFSDISNFIDKELGTSTDVNSVGSNGFLPPWKIDPDKGKSVFWTPVDIDPLRWNRLYPYRLVVIDVSKPGKPQIVGSGVFDAFDHNVNAVPREQGLEYTITQTARMGKWEVVLPITPQQLKITDQFAINTSATMRGIVEEHNGVKFKTISASGTTGIWSKKPSNGGNIRSPSSIGSIASGTLEATQGLIKSINKVADSFSGNHPNRGQKNVLPENSNAGSFSTGYYQALYLGQFFERYAEAKKNPVNKGWRLVFDMPKQNQSFIVTPVTFESAQSEQKPNQYIFSFQLKAWKRINLEDDFHPDAGEVPGLTANEFQKLVNTLSATRRALSSATNLIKAVRSDFQKPFNILRQTTLAIKDLGGLIFSVGDLPRQLVKDMQSSIQGSLGLLSGGFQLGSSSSHAAAGSTIVLKNSTSNKVSSSSQKAGDVVSSILEKQKINEGLSNDEIASGALGTEAAQRLDTDPLNDVFNNPEANFDLFDGVSIDDLTPTPAQRLAIEDELLNVRLLNINNFRTMRQEIVSLAHDISDNFGAGNSTYNYIYGLPNPKTRPIPMTVEENEIVQTLFESIQVYDSLISTKKYDDFNIENPLEFVGGLANESDIDFEQFSSKLLAPVPFGLTIEEIAARYMGDSSKWLEIVTLNSLRSPYIDEIGFTYSLLSNAEGRQFNVDDTANNLFIGQKIVIKSNVQSPISRKIINLEKIGDNNFLVTVDGLANLEIFQTMDSAKIQGYAPGTVNSQNQIYIPTNLPADVDDRTFEVANVPTTALNKLAKIDFLLTDNFDIAINSQGDFRLANGLTNLIQALKLKIRTQKGTILKHLEYGVGLTHGISVSDIENGTIIKSMNAMIASDSRFESIESLRIKLNGSTMTIDMTVRIANGSGILPISFDIRPT